MTLPKPVQAPLDQDFLYLHMEIVNGRQRVVDQDGRVLKGVIDSVMNANNKGIATISLEVEVAARLDDDGTIGWVI